MNITLVSLLYYPVAFEGREKTGGKVDSDARTSVCRIKKSEENERAFVSENAFNLYVNVN